MSTNLQRLLAVLIIYISNFARSSHDRYFIFIKAITSVFFIAISQFTCAQISINSDNFPYAQNFNSLATTSTNHTWTNNVTLEAWYAAGEDESDEDPDTPPVPIFMSTYRGNTGSNSDANLCSYGNSADRALGALNKDNSFGAIAYGVHFQNNSGSEILSLTLSMRVEQWRSPYNEKVKSHQRIKVSYGLGNPINISPTWMLDSAQFTDVPEAYLINDDTTTMDASTALIGNNAPNYHNITVTLPVSIPPGFQFFLRFFDENSAGTDVAFGVDDLNVTFHHQPTSRIVATSGSTVYAYVDMGMNEEIPDVGSPHTYIVPTAEHMADWQQILTHFFNGEWASVDALAADYGYVLTYYTQQDTDHSFYILRKTNASPYFWGTFVKAENPDNMKLVFECPHPIDDQFTGRQTAALYHLTEAEHLFIAGAGRCVSGDFSPCVGQTKTCSTLKPRVDEDYRMSDVAHATQSIFHLATVVLSGLLENTVFLQLHGFSSNEHPKHFYISSGTMDGYQKSVPDYSVSVREQLKLYAPVWQVQIPHVDNDEELGARDNPQGRFLNLYTPELDFCANDEDPVTVTNRFLHIEQYNEFRRSPLYYPPLAAALSGIINDSEYIRQIRISDPESDYVQNFDNLPDAFPLGETHTWGNNLHLPGWYAVRGNIGLFSNYIISDGSAATGGLYSFGEMSGDRALGTLNAVDENGSGTGRIAYGMLFRNDTGETIYGVDLTYNVEQWRKVNGQTQSVNLSYTIGNAIDLTSNGLLNDALFTNVPAGDLMSTQSVGTGAVNGNLAATTISSLSIPLILNDGQELFIRFLDEDVGGAGTNDVALALDNLSVSFSTMGMPVTWRYFEVEKSGSYALLRWGADVEFDCEQYQVQRSIDGKEFHTISSNECQRLDATNHYVFKDIPPMQHPLVYYRICQRDFDGTTICSQIRVFKQKIRPTPIVRYENNSLPIGVSGEAKVQRVSVMDSMGRQFADGVPVRESSNQYRMDCSLPPGRLFIVRVQLDNGTYSTRIRTQ